MLKNERPGNSAAASGDHGPGEDVAEPRVKVSWDSGEPGENRLRILEALRVGRGRPGVSSALACAEKVTVNSPKRRPPWS